MLWEPRYLTEEESWHSFFDLDQRFTGRGREVHASVHEDAHLSTLIQHQVLWHHGKQEVLTSSDAARAHCWPIAPEEQAHVGSVICIKTQLEDWMSHRTLMKAMGGTWGPKVCS